jgi:uncharacterized protein YuzB (UPF0349 family)
MDTMMSIIDKNAGVGTVQLIKNVVESYTFIDYALIKSYKEGVAEVTLAHTMQGKDVTLTNVEILAHGSKAFATTFALVKGDIVMLFSSRSLIDTIAGFTSATSKVINSYDIATIKALPIADATASTNKLDIADDGSFKLTGPHSTISVGADGAMELDSDAGFTIDSKGDVKVNSKSMELDSTTSVTIDAKGAVSIKGATTITIDALAKIVLKSLGTAAWCPNVITVCPFTGAPHGGTAAGVIGLAGA